MIPSCEVAWHGGDFLVVFRAQATGVLRVVGESVLVIVDFVTALGPNQGDELLAKQR